jgi:hypothetical protein
MCQDAPPNPIKVTKSVKDLDFSKLKNQQDFKPQNSFRPSKSSKNIFPVLSRTRTIEERVDDIMNAKIEKRYERAIAVLDRRRNRNLKA